MSRRLLLFVGLLLGSSLLVVACGGTDDSEATPPEPAVHEQQMGCSPALPHESGDSGGTIESGGLTREYSLYVPPSYSEVSGAQATPLVLYFHGFGQSAHVAGQPGLRETADREGFILAAPQGLRTEHVNRRHWNFTIGQIDPEPADDVAFVSDLLDALEADLCIDSARVYATGFSNGAQFSVRLACDLSERIAAIAPVGGVYFPPFSPDLPNEPPCAGERPVPVIAFHGAGEFIEGGTIDLGAIFGVGKVVYARATELEYMPDWASYNGCRATPTEEQTAIAVVTGDVLEEFETRADVRLIRHEDCEEGADVRLYVIPDLGHVWPDPPSSATTPPPARDLPIPSEVIWEFFAEHPLSTRPSAG